MNHYRHLPVTLGIMLRSIRMGYRIFNNRYFLRISKEKALYRIDLAPFSGVDPKRKTWDGSHFCWWEAENTITMINSIPCLKNVTAVHRPISFLITETGTYAGS